jgi:hypothetical protein
VSDPQAVERASVAEILKSLVQSSTIARLERYAKVKDLRVERLATKSKVLGHRMALIMVSGNALRITLKMHYMDREVRLLASGAIAKDASDITSREANDFLGELCNLVAGKISVALEEQNIPSGISLPVLTRGFDEIFFEVPSTPSAFADRWLVIGPGVRLCQSIFMEIRDPAAFANFRLPDHSESEERSGELNFL